MQLLDKEINPLVSVIVLSYNSNKLLTALQSVVNQIYLNIEIIIADDGSNEFDEEKIYEIVVNRKENIKRIIISRNTENLGTIKNYNSAIKLSSGKYIINLASDDIFANKRVINEIVSFFIKFDCDILVAKASSVDKDVDINKLKRDKYFNFLNHGSMDKAFNLLARGNFLSGACTYYRKEYFNKYGLFNEKYRLIEDWSNILFATRENIRINFIDYTSILYSLGGVSTMKNKSKNYIDDYIQIINNEIIPFKENLSLLTYRYNLFMKKYLLNLSTFEKIILYSKYIDIVLYKLFRRIK